MERSWETVLLPEHNPGKIVISPLEGKVLLTALVTIVTCALEERRAMPLCREDGAVVSSLAGACMRREEAVTV
ncbi:hypothetical protein BDV36DRAFT_259016 [Aspergillus pseudocaelatus]|uniref:Uncharacterized protein n=1 Tax=Aspergillus pseudocaelatus TaxID=1825620 RepID=A0ABQ6WI67_9EURO|nr:hypothetical protein BDV36DRAFT_259016 [Aspergillus pseudocaelatus]